MEQEVRRKKMPKPIISLKAMTDFAYQLFDNSEEDAALIMKAILETRSPRLSDISQAMPGSPAANYKAIQRFLDKADPEKALKRLFMEDAPFVIADPTEIPRPQAGKLSYVGRLKDGKRGFWLLVLGVPYRGRALPFHFITYSSRTIGSEATSRNLEHSRAFGEVKKLLEGIPLVMDREFSYLTLFEELREEKISYVIRLNHGNNSTIMDKLGDKVSLSIMPGEKKLLEEVYYQGKVKVNLAGEWKAGLKEPLWVISDLLPERALEIYRARMKIEESFKDLKSLLFLEKVMNKKRELMEKMVAMVQLAYSIGLLVGEEIRDRIYGGGKKERLYSGLFILLRQRVQLAKNELRRLLTLVNNRLKDIVRGLVRSFA
jgi:hypothetical protein